MPRRRDISSLRECQPQRICVIKPSALGDVVQSLPVLAGLKSRWPDASISWVIRHDLAELVDGHPLIDHWMSYHRRGGWRPFARLLRQLHAGSFDLTIDLQGLARSATMTLATAAPLRVGLQTSRDASSLSHNLILPNTGRDVPAHSRYARLAETLAVAPPPEQPPIPISDAAMQAADRLLAPCPSPMLVVHPGAMWESKRWPVGRFVAIAHRAVRELGTGVVVIGGPHEINASRRFVDSLRAVQPGAMVRDLTGQTSIGQLAAVLDRCDLLLTNDSGPMHLAAALDTPVVGVFTSTSPVISGPPVNATMAGPRHQLVGSTLACAGCYRRQCPLAGQRKNACRRDLSVDRVWQAVVDSVVQNRLVAGAATNQAAESEPALFPAD